MANNHTSELPNDESIYGTPTQARFDAVAARLWANSHNGPDHLDNLSGPGLARAVWPEPSASSLAAGQEKAKELQRAMNTAMAAGNRIEAARYRNMVHEQSQKNVSQLLWLLERDVGLHEESTKVNSATKAEDTAKDISKDGHDKPAGTNGAAQSSA